VLSRIVYGSRTAMLVGFACAFFGATIGAVIGVTSAYFGGRVDLLIQRVNDIFLAFPLIILALAVVSILGTGITNVIMAITVPMIPRAALVARSSALAIRELPYVDAARAAGFRHRRIILRHMLPNVMAPYLIMLTAYLGQAILAEASLSFLGLGVSEPTAAWGLMLRGAAVQGAVDGDLPGPGHQPGRVRVQSLRRFAARCARPAAEDPVGEDRRRAKPGANAWIA
jgi:peptide/nickel transport system permease protein